MRLTESLYRLQKLKFKRELRKNMTPAEHILWEELRNRRLVGSKWRRQANIDIFIADFLCKEHRLIIELDGGIHAQKHEYDQLRTEEIAARYRVIRFKNDEIFKKLPAVLQQIVKAMSLPPTRSPRILRRGSEPNAQNDRPVTHPS